MSSVNGHANGHSPDEKADPGSATMDDRKPSEQGHDPAPFQHSFWSPAVAQQRKGYIKALVGATVMTTFALLGVLSIYWGALWDTSNGVHKLTCAVVDFDGGAIGQAVSQTFLAMAGPKTTLGYYSVPSTDFASPADVGQHVVDETFWLAIVVNPGATDALNSAISTADASYNGSLAITVYTNTARSQQAFSTYAVPQIERVMMQFQQKFSAQNAQSVAASANLATILRQAPQVVTMPAGYSMDDVRSFDIPVANAATFVGLIYLLIISFFVTMQTHGAREATGIDRQLTLRSLILLRFGSALAIYFILSWVYCFITLAFQAPFGRFWGGRGFPIYWAISFVAMTALGFALESMITLLTVRFVPFFLLLWIIINVSVCFFPIEMLPTIFRYGYATPFYNVSLTVRTILFNTRNQIGLNFGVEFAWIAVSVCTLILFQTLVRRRAVRHMATQSHANGRATP